MSQSVSVEVCGVCGVMCLHVHEASGGAYVLLVMLLVMVMLLSRDMWFF